MEDCYELMADEITLESATKEGYGHCLQIEGPELSISIFINDARKVADAFHALYGAEIHIQLVGRSQ